MFTKAAEACQSAKVLEAMLADPPDWRKDAGPNDFDVCLHLEVQTANGPERDWWRGEMSPNFCKGQNVSHKRQFEMTQDALRSIGFDNPDLTAIDTLVGTDIPVNIKEGKPNKDGKVYMNVYLGAGFSPKAIDKNAAASRLRAMMGDSAGGAAAQAPAMPVAGAGAGAAPLANPFGGTKPVKKPFG
jgi:hypothetical protein